MTPIGLWLRQEAPNKILNLLPQFLSLFILGGCSGGLVDNTNKSINLRPIDFNNLPGWSGGQQADALWPFSLSCRKIMVNVKPNSHRDINFGSINSWRTACKKLDGDKFNNHTYARMYFEENFRAFLVVGEPHTKTQGLFTGYYEPQFEGATKNHGKYRTPIYPTPYNLFKVSGKYYSRKQINRGVIKRFAKPIAWLSDPIDAIFLHIQGSGRIKLPNNSIIRLGYAGHNRHPYTSIGRILIRRGEIPREHLSMQTIRAWLRQNPTKVTELLERNARYVFFRRLTTAGPVGAQGVLLTPGRSLAIDPKFLIYGLPTWVDTIDPLDADKTLRRLFITQDTGGAIKGVVRGDVFFGHGRVAAKRAGSMNRRGRYYVLIPI